jgi:hypothetical protein
MTIIATSVLAFGGEGGPNVLSGGLKSVKNLLLFSELA